MVNGHMCGGCRLGKGALKDGLHILWRSSQPAGRRFVEEEYCKLGTLCRDFSQHRLNKDLKVKTSNASKKQMDFLSEVVEKGLYGTIFSTLYAGTAGNDAIDLELVELIRNRSYIKVPLDQKNFDHYQNVMTIQAVMGAIGDHFATEEVPEEYMEMWGLYGIVYS